MAELQTALITAFTTLQGDLISIISNMLPIIVEVVGATIAVKFGIGWGKKFFSKG